MAEPGDPENPAETDPDDLVGFASPGALSGRSRERAPAGFDGPHPAFAGADRADVVAPAFGRAHPAPSAAIEGVMGLYAVYALILFAVPTLGVSALIGLVATRRLAAPTDALALSHALYQKRTLWAAAAAGVAGVVLILINLGVLVLFLLAVWVIVRGAAGAMRLKAGEPIAHPLGWLI